MGVSKQNTHSNVAEGATLEWGWLGSRLLLLPLGIEQSELVGIGFDSEGTVVVD
jgi:hypothetical protein